MPDLHVEGRTASLGRPLTSWHHRTKDIAETHSQRVVQAEQRGYEEAEGRRGEGAGLAWMKTATGREKSEQVEKTMA